MVDLPVPWLPQMALLSGEKERSTPSM